MARYFSECSMAVGLWPVLPGLGWQLVTGTVLMQLFMDPLHLGVAQIATQTLFLHCHTSIVVQELIKVMVDFMSGAEAGAGPRDIPIGYSASFPFGRQDVLLPKSM